MVFGVCATKVYLHCMEDKILVTAILGGDEHALRQFWRDYSPKLLAFIRKRVANSEDADEIFQDTFLAAIESMRDFDFRSTLSTFICAIGQHKIIDYYRRRRIKQIFLSQISEDFLPLVSQFLGPEEEFDTNEVKRRIGIVFEKLRPLYRKIIILKYIEGLSVTAIAKLLTVTSKSAESTLFRARMAFAEIYQTT